MSRGTGLLPGLVLVAGLAIAARASTLVLPDLISEITVGIVAGLLVGNIVALPSATIPGIRFAVHRLLRVGIALLGVRLALPEVFGVGAVALLLVVVGAAIVFGVMVLLGRLLRLPPRLALLIAVGTAICGNSAIVATAPMVEAHDRDVSLAVAIITLFGLSAVVLYPMIGHVVAMDDRTFGYWAGAAVNDTSQVAATGFAYSSMAGETAMVVKLVRNTLMAPLLVIIAAWYVRSGLRRRDGEPVGTGGIGLFKAVPQFVLAFFAIVVINSMGLVPSELRSILDEASRLLILAALVGVGLSTDVATLTRTGSAPFVAGFGVAAVLAAVSLGLIQLVL